jgi:hypothetical protein
MTKNAPKLIAITQTGLLITAALSANTLVASAAKDNSPKNYEAILSVELQQGTATKDLVKAIKKDLGNLNDIDIISLSSKLDFEGKAQTLTKSNEEQISSQRLLDIYPKFQNAFLTTLVNMKDQIDSGQTVESQEAIKPVLNKYSKKELKSTQEKYKVKTPVVSNVMIAGSMPDINKLNLGSLKTISIKVELINLVESQKQSDEIKAKLEKANTPEAKDKILKDEIAKTPPQGVNQQSSLNFDQNKIQAIDKLTRKDLNGNIFINSDEVKTKVGLTDTQVAEVLSAMNKFNKLPLELKDNSFKSMQAVAQTTQLKTEENNQKDIGEKVSQFLLGSIKASALNCYTSTFQADIHWYGGDFTNTQCGWAGAGALLGTIWTAIAMTASALCTAGYAFCAAAAISTVGGWIVNVSGTAAWTAGGCRGGGYWGRSTYRVYIWNFTQRVIECA